MRIVAALWLLLTVTLAGQIRFQDVAQKAGLRLELKNGAAGEFHLIELMPGGVAALDFNNDGCMDVFFTNGASVPSLRKDGPQYSNRLFRNNCDGTFIDVTEKAGVAGEGYSMAAAAADYNNDGFVDIFVAGVNRNFLYRNRGDGTFEDVTAKAGLSGIDPKFGKMWSISAGWFDADNDGWLDLFVSTYVAWDPKTEKPCGPPENRYYCHPDDYAGRPHQLFRNNRDGTFTDVSQSSGIAGSIGRGMGVAFADFNRDGLTDVFVANDSVRNFLFQNLGNFRFKEVGLETGASLGEAGRAVASMGADFRDYDNDGLPDIVVTALINDSFLLFRNLGPPTFFEDYTIRSALKQATQQLTGWSMGMFDFDNDGFKDLFFANSHFPHLGQLLGIPSPLANSIFRNLGNGKFADVSKQAGPDFQNPGFYHGAAFADFDGDGRIDVIVTAINSPARLYKNTTPDAGHWIAFKLVGTRSNRDGLGAEIQVTLPGGRMLYNQASTSVGYASSSEPLVRFGLGAQPVITRVRIRWPSGFVQELKNVKGDRVVRIRETPGS
ncbi:MAG TPA: CRTAC1 family protein [Bryobacteraceae bacterium]|nr:CRTAC1 family protein [Bryobacteraceae bacterium]